MATPIGNMVVHLGLDNNGFEQKLKRTETSLRAFKQNLKKMEGQLETSRALSKYATNGAQAFKAYRGEVRDLNRLIPAHLQYQKKLASEYERIQQGSLKLKGDIKQLNTAIENNKTATKNSATETKNLKARMDEVGRTAGKNSEEYKNLAAAYQRSKDRTKELATETTALKGHLDRQVKALKDNTDQANSYSEQWEKSRQKVAQYRYEMQEAIQTQYSQHSTAARVGQDMTKVGQGLTTISQNTRGLTMAVGAGFAYVTKEAVQFEDGMQTIQALIADDVPATKMKSTMATLSNAVKDYSTTYGISTGEVIEGMQEMIRRGYNVNQTLAAMPHVLEASKASGEGFSEVMEISTAILEQFNLKAKDTQRVTDSLTFVANKTASDFHGLGLAMQYVGPMAATAGVSLETTASAIGLLSQRGIEGEKAGTNLRAIMTALVAPTKSQAKAFEQLGISTDKFKAGEIDLADVLDLARVNTEGLTGAQKAALYSQAVGRTGQAGFNALIAQGGDALRKLTAETNNAKGATKRMADLMMESTSNQLKKAKEQFSVLAIELGEDLLPAINDLMKEGLEVIEWLNNLSPGAKDAALKFALVTAAVSPFTGVLGWLLKVGGGSLSMLASLAGKVKSMNALWRVADGAKYASSLASIGTIAGETTTGVAGLSSAVGILGNPITWGVLAGGAVLGSLALVGQYFDDAAARTEKWGTSISKVQENELTRFKADVDEANRLMATFGSEGGASVKEISDAVEDLNSEIEKLTDKQLKKDVKLAEALGFSDEEIQKIKDNASETKDTYNHMSDDVINIYKNANEQHRALSEEERQIVRSAQNAMIEEKLKLMGYEKDETIAIRKAMNGQVNELNDTQRQEASKTIQGWIDDENKAYKKSKDNLKDLLDRKVIDQETYNKHADELEAEHLATVEAYNEQLKKVKPELPLLEFGETVADARKKIEELSETASEGSNLVGEYWQGMSEEARKAVTYWNSIVLDPKTGEVKTNAQEAIQEALKAEGGWGNIKLALKEGKLTTNAATEVGQALLATGKWNKLKPGEKKLVTDNSQAMYAITSSEANLKAWKEIPDPVKKLLMEDDEFTSDLVQANTTLGNWNSLSVDDKKLLANNEDVLNKIIGSTETLNTWNGLSAEDKKLLANNDDVLNKVLSSTEILNGWNSLPAEDKKLLADNSKLGAAVTSSVDSLNRWNSLTPEEKEIIAKDSVSDKAAIAKAALDLITGKDVVISAQNETDLAVLAALEELGLIQNKTALIDALDNTGGAVATATYNVNSPHQNAPAAINASNNTAGQVASANNAVNSPRQKSPAAINASNKTAGQVSAANNAVNSVRQGSPTSIRATNLVHGAVRGALASLASLPVTKWITIAAKKVGFEKGTDYHMGGLAMVNDQKGAVYKELVTLPNGYSFIPQGRDVTLPLPKGSKVLNATRTKALMRHMGIPKYAAGIGYSADSPLFKAMDKVEQRIQPSVTPVAPDNAAVIAMLQEIAEVLRDNSKKTPVVANYLDSELITKRVTEIQDRKTKIDSIMRGVML